MADLVLSATNIRPLDGAHTRQYQTSAAAELGEAVTHLETGYVEKTAGASAKFRGVIVSGSGKDSAGVVASGEDVGVCIFGPVSGFSGLTPGTLVYLSATAGNLADTGSIVVGYVENATTIFIMPAIADSAS
jgi:hypothetical protein